jgi:hypothetical protein
MPIRFILEALNVADRGHDGTPSASGHGNRKLRSSL